MQHENSSNQTTRWRKLFHCHLSLPNWFRPSEILLKITKITHYRLFFSSYIYTYSKTRYVKTSWITLQYFTILYTSSLQPVNKVKAINHCTSVIHLKSSSSTVRRGSLADRSLPWRCSGDENASSTVVFCALSVCMRWWWWQWWWVQLRQKL